MGAAKIVVEQLSPSLVTEVFEYKIVVGNAPGKPGADAVITAQSIGDVIAAAEAKTELVDADGIAVSNSEDGDILVEWTFGSLKAQLTAFFSAIYQRLFNTQNLGTISGAKTINATSFSTITGDFTASFTATFEGFTASRKSVLLHLVVSGGGAPTITIAGYTFTFMTTANLTAMADGTYQVVVNNPKTDTTAFVYVKLAP